MSRSAELLLLLFYFIDDLTAYIHTMPTVILSDIISEFQTVMFVIVDIQTVFFKQCVDSSVVTAIKSKETEKFHIVSMLLFYILQRNYPD
jgi:hypothetical protein